jgi:hypothetical protein
MNPSIPRNLPIIAPNETPTIVPDNRQPLNPPFLYHPTVFNEQLSERHDVTNLNRSRKP